MQQVIQEQLMNGFNAPPLLLILGLREQCNYGKTQWHWQRQLTNSGHQWLPLSELYRPVYLRLAMLYLSCLSLKQSRGRISATTVYLTRSMDQSLATQKGADVVADLLYLTLQTYVPSEPIARIVGPATIEAPIKPSRTFPEALFFFRSWRQQVITVARDLGGNPEPLKLYGALRTISAE